MGLGVPNVPCGVESNHEPAPSSRPRSPVPNVPCGVERSPSSFMISSSFSFLMCRVELKGILRLKALARMTGS